MLPRKQKVTRVFAFLLTACLLVFVLATAQALDTLVSAPLIIRKESTNGMVRVYLSSLGNPSVLNITVSGSYTINGKSTQQIASGAAVTVNFSSTTGKIMLAANGTTRDMGSAFKLRRHSTTGSNGLKIAQARSSNNLYPGDLSFISILSGTTYKLYTIAYIFIEDYLYGVLPYEIGNSSPAEALKAQAVTARTYTLRAMFSRTSSRYDVVDTTSDQMYSGTPSGSSASKAAVDSTKGIIAMNGGSFTATYYTASNGGQIESVKNVWGSTSYGYITVKDDPYDLMNPDSRVRSYAISSDAVQGSTLVELLKLKARVLFSASIVTINRITEIIPHTPKYASPSRLYTKMDFYINAAADGTSRTGILTFDIFSELETPLGMGINTSANELWSVVKSSTGFSIKARRYGHGTGLSQRGAMYMAELGYTYAQILAFYFEGCSRIQYSLTSSILSPVVSDADSAELTTVEPAADITDVETCTAIVTLSSVPAVTALRKTAETGGPVLVMLKHGSEVIVHTISSNWCLVQYGALTGFVLKSTLSISGSPDQSGEEVTMLSGYGVVAGTDSLNLRGSASYTGTVISMVPRNTVLPLISISGSWAYTQYGRLNGYVALGFLTQYNNYPGDVDDSASVGARVDSGDGTADFRMTASNTGYIISELQNGALVSVKYDDGSWCYVVYNGANGYILSSELTYTDQPVQEDEDTIGEDEFAATANPDASTLNMRATPSTAAAIVFEIPKGDKLIVAQKGGTWCGIRYKGVSGYVMTKYILIEPEPGEPVATARVNTKSGSLNLRLSASSAASVLAAIPQNTILPVYKKGNTWCYVTYGSYKGYVMTAYLTFIGTATVSPTPVLTPAPTVPAVTATPSPAPSAGKLTARVTTVSGSLNLRIYAKAYSRVLTTIPQNTIIEVLSPGSVWTKVLYRNYSGYVMTTFITYIAQNTTAPTLMPTATPDGPQPADYARVTTSSGSLNLRLSASPTSLVLTTIPRNTVITVLSRGSIWTKVTYRSYTGYVMSAFLTFSASAPSVLAASSPVPSLAEGVMKAKVVTASGSLNIRALPSLDAKVISTVPQDTVITVDSRETTWSHITFGDSSGYVLTSFLLFTNITATQTPEDYFDPGSDSVQDTLPPAAPSHSPEAAPLQDSVPEPDINDTSMQFLDIPEVARIAPDSSTLNLRADCSIHGLVLLFMPKDDYLTVIARGEAWCAVVYKDIEGYCMTQYLVFFND